MREVQGLVKAAHFEYVAPASVAEVCDLLSGSDDDVKVIAGGQSLVPLMNFRLARPPRLVDINRIADLNYGRLEDRRLEVGALYRERQVELNPTIMSACGAISDAVPLIGHVGIRNRGTVVGSLAHGDPLAEWASLALLLDGQIEAVSHRGSRTIAARDWLKGFLETDLDPDELVRSVSFDLGPPESGTSFLEITRRHGDFAIVGVAALIELDSAALISRARVVIAGLGPLPYRMSEVEEYLCGRAATAASFNEAAALGADGADSRSDLHASGAYRRAAAGALIARALSRSAVRAGRSETS